MLAFWATHFCYKRTRPNMPQATYHALHPPGLPGPLPLASMRVKHESANAVPAFARLCLLPSMHDNRLFVQRASRHAIAGALSGQSRPLTSPSLHSRHQLATTVKQACANCRAPGRNLRIAQWHDGTAQQQISPCLGGNAVAVSPALALQAFGINVNLAFACVCAAIVRHGYGSDGVDDAAPV